MKLGVVVQRYGTEVVGGAELHAREVAERLAQVSGLQVEILTTTAFDYRTWANHYPSGLSSINGLKVRRFPVWFGRIAILGAYGRVLSLFRKIFGKIPLLGSVLLIPLELLWMILQGPFSPSLILFLRRNRNQYDKVLFFTYLYFPTVAGSFFVKDKALLVPTAHDEPPFYFHLVRLMLRKWVTNILCNTEVEADLVRRQLLNPKDPKVSVVGLGFEVGLQNSLPRQKEAEYFLYMGRISKGKGVDQLISWFLTYSKDHHLYLGGLKEEGFVIPDDKRIHYLGFVNVAEKDNLIMNAKAIINPSPLESLSMITLEGIAFGKPVLVNGHCDVLKYYSQQMTTVLAFYDAVSFGEALEHVNEIDWQEPHQTQQLHNSQRWVHDQYSWAAVMKRLLKVLRDEDTPASEFSSHQVRIF